MTVFIAFLLSVFVIAAAFERRGKQINFRTMMIMTTVLAMSFYSLRVMS